jgi:hypothetical protein
MFKTLVEKESGYSIESFRINKEWILF